MNFDVESDFAIAVAEVFNALKFDFNTPRAESCVVNAACFVWTGTTFWVVRLDWYCVTSALRDDESEVEVVDDMSGSPINGVSPAPYR